MRQNTIQNTARVFKIIEVIDIVLVIGILLTIIVPHFSRMREKSGSREVSVSRKRIDTTTPQWAMDAGATAPGSAHL